MYLFLVSTFAYAIPAPVSEEKKEYFENKHFYSDTEGPDRIDLIETPTEAFEIRLNMIKNAKRNIIISYHAIHQGDTTNVFFGELLKAADNGVEVQIVLDAKAGSMSSNVKDILKNADAHENISFRRYNPAHFLKPWEFHSLLHDKYIIVDNEYLLLGGRNIGDKYYDPVSLDTSVVNDRDVFVWNSAQSENSVIYEVLDYFSMIWEDCEPLKNNGNQNNDLINTLYKSTESFKSDNPKFYVNTLEDYKNGTVRTNKISLLYNPINHMKKEPWVAYQVRQIALGAKESVLLQTPYATGNKNLLKAMEAVSANVKTDMLTNSLASSPNFPAFSNYSSQRNKFVNTGVTIHELQSTDSIHGKSLVIDDRLSIVGSLNMDDRSFYIDTETMLVIDSPEFSDILSEAINHYMDMSLVVGENNKYILSDSVKALPVPFTKTVIMFLASIISRLFQFLI